MLSEPSTADGAEGLRALLDDPGSALVAFDYDGTLAPIVDDPMQARPHPRVIRALEGLAAHVRLVAVVTGRPAALAVELAGLDDVPGLRHIVVVGHYGLERWDAATGQLSRSDPPPGLDDVRKALPALLESCGVDDANVEDKGLSVAVHVRRSTSPDHAFQAIRGPLDQLAEQHGLVAEPGRYVVELRPPGMDKGRALRALADETAASTVVFCGDDLGDLAAFAEVIAMRRRGVRGLLLCSGSDEVSALAEQADLVVDGPAGLAEWLEAVVDRLGPA